MVMAMYSRLKESGGALSAPDAHAALDGNFCRCTGYQARTCTPPAFPLPGKHDIVASAPQGHSAALCELNDFACATGDAPGTHSGSH